MIDERFVILGAIISLVGGLSYVRDVLRGKAKPNRVSWAVWGMAPIIAFFAQLSKGGGLASLTTFMAGFGPILVLTASFFNKKSEWKMTKFDLSCGALSVVGLIAWALTSDGLYAIIFGVTADLLAAIPTLIKSYKYPETENYTAFFTSGIGSAIGLLVITNWTFSNYGFPVYLVAINIIFFSLIKFKLGKKISRLFS